MKISLNRVVCRVQVHGDVLFGVDLQKSEFHRFFCFFGSFLFLNFSWIFLSGCSGSLRGN